MYKFDQFCRTPSSVRARKSSKTEPQQLPIFESLGGTLIAKERTEQEG